MDTTEQPTCGKGLAENSILPQSLGRVISAMAENLAEHMKALDLHDSNSKVEHDVYERLVGQLRQAAAELHVTASEMAGYRDLPMGRHDEHALIRPVIREAFENFVRHKQELSTLLQQTAARDKQLLEMIRAHGQ
jgi:hypothetical protein